MGPPDQLRLREVLYEHNRLWGDGCISLCLSYPPAGEGTTGAGHRDNPESNKSPIKHLLQFARLQESVCSLPALCISARDPSIIKLSNSLPSVSCADDAGQRDSATTRHRHRRRT